MQPAWMRSSRAGWGGCGFAPVTHMMKGRDGARPGLCLSVLLVTRSCSGGQVIFCFLLVLSGVKEQTESSYAAAEITICTLFFLLGT